ncbi:E3 ubiquitin-protein ligase TOM1-like [Astathelohania contejeani]|uniref:HECT-type E3 ubiquitin transferase n=1 Tax=Astathelohania contejeani TaxID=164912 RepID=A0ABQ7I1G8_9MICR|nr:E3 ubiquitin-protein ligase TOM1-like [Thelohania contejeani]
MKIEIYKTNKIANKDIPETQYIMDSKNKPELTRRLNEVALTCSLTKNNLTNWLTVLNFLDAKLETTAKKYFQNGLQVLDFQETDKLLINSIFKFYQALVLRASYRSIFNSYEWLVLFSYSFDLDLAYESLKCLYQLCSVLYNSRTARYSLSFIKGDDLWPLCLKPHSQALPQTPSFMQINAHKPEKYKNKIGEKNMHEGKIQNEKKILFKYIRECKDIILTKDIKVFVNELRILFYGDLNILEIIKYKAYACDVLLNMEDVEVDALKQILYKLINIISDKNQYTDLRVASIELLDAFIVKMIQLETIFEIIDINFDNGIIISIFKNVLKNEEDSSQDFINAFFKLLVNIISHPTGAARMLDVGLLNYALDNIGTKYNTELLIIIQTMISTIPAALNKLFDLNGIAVLCQNSMISQEFTVSVLKLFYNILKFNEQRETLINKFLDTEIPSLIRATFDSQILDAIPFSLSIIGYYIHMLPTNIPVIMELGLHECIFSLFNNIPKNSKLIFSLIDVIDALCLYSPIINSILEKNIMKKLIFILLDDDYFGDDNSKVLVFGSSIEELIRHHPVLSDKVIEGIMEVGNKIKEKMNTNRIISIEVEPFDIKNYYSPETKYFKRYLKFLDSTMNDNLMTNLLENGGLALIVSIYQLPIYIKNYFSSLLLSLSSYKVKDRLEVIELFFNLMFNEIENLCIKLETNFNDMELQILSRNLNIIHTTCFIILPGDIKNPVKYLNILIHTYYITSKIYNENIFIGQFHINALIEQGCNARSIPYFYTLRLFNYIYTTMFRGYENYDNEFSTKFIGLIKNDIMKKECETIQHLKQIFYLIAILKSITAASTLVFETIFIENKMDDLLLNILKDVIECMYYSDNHEHNLMINLYFKNLFGIIKNIIKEDSPTEFISKVNIMLDLISNENIMFDSEFYETIFYIYERIIGCKQTLLPFITYNNYLNINSNFDEKKLLKYLNENEYAFNPMLIKSKESFEWLMNHSRYKIIDKIQRSNYYAFYYMIKYLEDDMTPSLLYNLDFLILITNSLFIYSFLFVKMEKKTLCIDPGILTNYLYSVKWTVDNAEYLMRFIIILLRLIESKSLCMTKSQLFNLCPFVDILKIISKAKRIEYLISGFNLLVRYFTEDYNMVCSVIKRENSNNKIEISYRSINVIYNLEGHDECLVLNVVNELVKYIKGNDNLGCCVALQVLCEIIFNGSDIDAAHKICNHIGAIFELLNEDIKFFERIFIKFIAYKTMDNIVNIHWYKSYWAGYFIVILFNSNDNIELKESILILMLNLLKESNIKLIYAILDLLYKILTSNSRKIEEDDDYLSSSDDEKQKDDKSNIYKQEIIELFDEMNVISGVINVLDSLDVSSPYFKLIHKSGLRFLDCFGKYASGEDNVVSSDEDSDLEGYSYGGWDSGEELINGNGSDIEEEEDDIDLIEDDFIVINSDPTLDRPYSGPENPRLSHQVLDDYVYYYWKDKNDFLRKYNFFGVIRRWVVGFHFLSGDINLKGFYWPYVNNEHALNDLTKINNNEMEVDEEINNEEADNVEGEESEYNEDICTFQEGCMCAECLNESDQSSVGDYNGEFPELDASVLNSLPENILREVIYNFYEERRSQSSTYVPINTNFFNSLNELPRIIFEEEELRHKDNYFVPKKRVDNPIEDIPQTKPETKFVPIEFITIELIDPLLRLMYYDECEDREVCYRVLSNACSSKRMRSALISKIIAVIEWCLDNIGIINNIPGDNTSDDPLITLDISLSLVSYLISMDDKYGEFFLQNIRYFNILNQILKTNDNTSVIANTINIIYSIGNTFKSSASNYDSNNPDAFIYNISNIQIDGFLDVIKKDDLNDKIIEEITEFLCMTLKYFVNYYIDYYFTVILEDCDKLLPIIPSTYNKEAYLILKRISRCSRCVLEISLKKVHTNISQSYYSYLRRLHDHPVWDKIFNSLPNDLESGSVLALSDLFNSFFIIATLRIEEKASELLIKSIGGNEDVSDKKNLLSSYNNPQFFSFFKNIVEKHSKYYNIIVDNNVNLLLGTLSPLLNMNVLNFDNKRKWMKNRFDSRKLSIIPFTIEVDRTNLFEDSFSQIMSANPSVLQEERLSIRFAGEEGVDAGGVSREWYTLIGEAMVNPDYALFTPSTDDKVTYFPNKSSHVNPEHLLFFRFAGRVVAKAIREDRLMDVHFSRPFYKYLLDRPVGVEDLESLDIYKSLIWMRNNSIDEHGMLDLTFSTDYEEFGKVSVVDLIPNGRSIKVTDSNKEDYIRLIAEFTLLKGVAKQLEAFKEGFYEIVDKTVMSIFNEKELELLICGLPDIDVDDWRNNTEYVGYTPGDSVVVWFWRAVRSFGNEDRARLLQFVTGTSRLPIGGFGMLQGSHGIQKFQIHRESGSTKRLPSAHTCFNQLDLPVYESYEELARCLSLAIKECGTGFGFV